MALFFWKFIPAKPTALNIFFLGQNVYNCPNYLGYEFRFGACSALKLTQLSQNGSKKIGKLCLISMSQKINAIIDFFRYYTRSFAILWKIHKRYYSAFWIRNLGSVPNYWQHFLIKQNGICLIRDGRGASFPRPTTLAPSASYCLRSRTPPALNKLLRVQLRAFQSLLPYCEYLRLLAPLFASLLPEGEGGRRGENK